MRYLLCRLYSYTTLCNQEILHLTESAGMVPSIFHLAGQVQGLMKSSSRLLLQMFPASPWKSQEYLDGTGLLEEVETADWTDQTLPSWRHSVWVRMPNLVFFFERKLTDPTENPDPLNMLTLLTFSCFIVKACWGVKLGVDVFEWKMLHF